jgi:hypothetical protein
VGPHETLIDQMAQDAVARLRHDVAGIIARLTQRFGELIGRLHAQDGRLAEDGWNAELAAKLAEEWLGVLRDAGWDDALDSLAATFENIAQANQGYVQNRLGRSFSAANLRSLARVADGSVERLLLRGDEAGAALREIVVVGAHTNAPLDDLLQQLSRAAGVTLNQAVIEAETQLMAFHREGLAVEAFEGGIDLFLYDGPDDGVTRPFCARFAGKIVTIQDLDDEENGEGQPKPVSRYLGGYRCRHILAPLSLEEAQAIVADEGASAIGPGQALARKILLEGAEGPAYAAWIDEARGSFVRGKVVRGG